MTSERDNCGLSSLLPASCRGRAEAFARNLQNRLSSLGSQDSSSDERSWLAGAHEKPIALSQPILNLEQEKYLDLESLQSPCSPQEELEESELQGLLNTVSLKSDTNGDCHYQKLDVESSKFYSRTNGTIFHNQSVDSDSEVFYDIDDDPPTQPYYTNGLKTSESSKSIESETGIDVNSQGTSSSNPSDTFATSLDCTPQPSVSDEISTLSLGDDCSIDGDIIAIEDNKCEGCEKNRGKQIKNENRKEETDFRNSENDEGYVNGEPSNGIDDSEMYVSTLSVINELVVECRITAELEKVEPTETNGYDKPADKKDDDEDDDENDDFIPRVRRCSSLKTGKTPPGTPGRKKIVRFADVLGLDLADVRTFLDEVPKVPKSAYNDLSDVDLSDSSDLSAIVQNTKYHGIITDRILIPQFDQPSGLPNFLDLIRDNQVCLENALVEDPILFLIKGTVRVRNLDFHKSVHIRYTLDHWKTFADVQGTYVDNSCDGFSDRFTFKIYAHTLTVGQMLEFAVRFQCKGCQYWDSNKGKNYCFQCLPSAASSTAAPIVNHGLADWGASFY